MATNENTFTIARILLHYLTNSCYLTGKVPCRQSDTVNPLITFVKQLITVAYIMVKMYINRSMT